MIERIFKYALPIGMVLIPYMVLTKGMIHASHQLGLVLFALICLGALTKNLWIFGFTVYLAGWNVALFWGSLNTFGVPTRAIMGMDMALYIIGGLIFFLAARHSTLKLATFYNFICVGAVLQALVAVLQFAGIDIQPMIISLFVPAKGKMPDGSLLGTLGNPNFLAAYLAISLPFFFRKGWAWFIPLLAAVLFLSWSSSALVPAVIATGWYFWDHECVRKLKMTTLYAGLFVILLYAGLLDNPVWESDRFGFWLQALYQLSDLPRVLFGLGPGAHWAREFPLHSEWITILHQFGIVGFGMVALYVEALPRGNRFLYAAMLVALINAGGNYNLHLAPSAAMIAVIAGLLERER